MKEKSRGNDAGAVISDILGHLRTGTTLSLSLQNFPHQFPLLYVSTVRSGEKTGAISDALRRYLAYHEQIDLIRNKVISASAYPLLLLGVGALVVMFLLGYVVPRFSVIYEDIGGDIPYLSHLLLEWGRFVSEGGWVVMPAGTLMFFLLILWVLRPTSRQWLLQALWQIPAIRGKLKLYELARLFRTLSMLIQGGVPLIPALGMSQGLLFRRALHSALNEAMADIKNGSSISASFSTHQLATDVGIRLLRVAEQSGDLGRSLERIAQIYDDEIARWIERFIKLFEPLMMIFTGFIIGLIVMLMYLPIFELANSIQ